MRSYAVVVLVATAALFAACDARQLAQQDALSNSNGCLATITKCEEGACATRNVMGVARWVCLRCLANYEPVVDASGQDNILQCVCPRGFYEQSSTATSCSRCPANQYCPGGEKVENPTSRGSNATCGDSLVTRNTGARSQSDCLAPAGYARSSPTSATACGMSEYAPQFNRLSKCLRCQSGLEENPALNLTVTDRATKKTVCKIPPGKFMSQGLVRICPQGFYRENWVDFDAAVGTLCLPCARGITTQGAGKGLRSDCNVVLLGYGVQTFNNVTNLADIPAPTPIERGGGLPNATMCDIGYYSLKGQCVACPSGTVTTVRGAKSIEECVVPPGYFLPAGASMQQCSASTFREGWLMFSDLKATACTPCGQGISSEPRDLDENPKAQNGSLVRATSASCFIDAGMGMIAQGQNLFAGQDCPINTYGAAGKVYGWAAAPCKPCPRNMITDNKVKVNNSDICINDNGFGYASEGASRCAPGFYSAKGSRKPCQQCPTGRTTADNPSLQRFSTDCTVKAGSGVVNSALNGTDAFNINITAMNSTQQAKLAVLECPVGYFGVGGSINAKCTPCPAGSTTEQPGSTAVSACSVCIAGFGKASANASFCTQCVPGWFQPGGMTVCTQCPNATFYTPVDGAGPTWTSTGITTFPGAVGVESCVPKESQLSPEAGQAYFGTDPLVQNLLTKSTRQTMGECLSSCPANSCCMAQYEVATKACKTATLAPVAADAAGYYKLFYKLPPSTMGSASSLKAPDATSEQLVNAVGTTNAEVVKGKMISSGIYARCVVPDAVVDNWMKVGTILTSDARTFSGETDAWMVADYVSSYKDCQQKCDESNVCWGFIHSTQYNQGICLYKGGEDALKTRSFFVVPTGVDLSPYNWQGATDLDVAVGNVMSLAASQGARVTKKDIVDALNQVYADFGYYDTIIVQMMLGLGS